MRNDLVVVLGFDARTLFSRYAPKPPLRSKFSYSIQLSGVTDVTP